MSRTLTLTALVGLLALAPACRTPRKACAQAERHVAKAVWLCPQVLLAQIDTVELPGDTLRDTLVWAPVDVDSLLAACDTLRRAAEVLALNSVNQQERMQATIRRQQAVMNATDALRRKACRVEPLNAFTADFDLAVWQGEDGALQYEVQLHPRTVPCPPCPVVRTTAAPAERSGIAPGWRTIALVQLPLLILLIMALFWSHSNKQREE